MGKTGWRRASGLTLAALFGMSSIVAAQKPAKQKPRQVPQTDVETAAPMTPAQAAGEALLEQMTSRSSEGLVELVHPDGTVSMDLQGRFMSVMVATPTAAGGHTVDCQTGHEALKHATADRTAKAIKVQKAPRALTPAPATTAIREIK